MYHYVHLYRIKAHFVCNAVIEKFVIVSANAKPSDMALIVPRPIFLENVWANSQTCT